MRRIHELRAAGVTILFVSHDTSDVKALCERCVWLGRGIVRGLGEADEVVAQYLATTLDRTQLPEPVAESAISDIHPHAIAEPSAGTHRFGNGAAEVTGIAMPGEPGGAEMLLRLFVRGNRPVTAPIAGFLVRNRKGESIFGTNSARENHPLPALKSGDRHTIDFRVTMPRLAAGAYSISVAISDGSIGEFEVCDYIEDAIRFHVPQGSAPVSGYMELPCTAVAIHRNQISTSTPGKSRQLPSRDRKGAVSESSTEIN
jgi:lipopolysaccharide transport system ATP-binding protein